MFWIRSKAIRWLFPFILACAFSLSATSRPLSFPDYDAAIHKSVKRYWPDFPDWKFWKAQLWQESRLDPAATSPAGAQGIAQFMPGTWGDVARQMGLGAVSPRDAKYAIQAGAYYMAKLRGGWTSPRPAIDRHDLALASYNAGFGNILKAQSRCDNPSLYADIIKCLPCVTGRHADETTTYVQKIHKWRRMMR